MDKRLLWGTFLLITLYMIIPWLISCGFGWGVLKKGKGKPIALTFDDGPHPGYTPMLLDLLAAHRIKATFFVLGRNAEKYPDIIRRIHEEGHCIGIHNYTHHPNWLLPPWTVSRKQVQRTAKAVESIIGVHPGFYRPPWGVMNLFDLVIHRSYRIVLWSVMIWDWRRFREGDENKLAWRLRRKMKDGSVVLLHDSGETPGADEHAPFFMLSALKSILAGFEHEQAQFVRIDELDAPAKASPLRMIRWSKRWIVIAWLIWEKLFAMLFDVVPVDQDNTLLKIRVRHYYGDQPIRLRDGEVIQKGDRIAELHLDNELLFQLGIQSKSMVHLTVQIVRRMEKLLPQILRLIETDPNYRNVKGLYGVSLIHRGTKQFGFTVIDLPKGAFSFVVQWYLRLLMYVIHPQGKERLQTKPELLVPKIIAISKQDLVNRYNGITLTDSPLLIT